MYTCYLRNTISEIAIFDIHGITDADTEQLQKTIKKLGIIIFQAYHRVSYKIVL